MVEKEEETAATLTSGSHNHKWTEPSLWETLEWEMASRYLKPLAAKGLQSKDQPTGKNQKMAWKGS